MSNIIQRIKCKLGLHNWGYKKVYSSLDMDLKESNWMKHCYACGKYEYFSTE